MSTPENAENVSISDESDPLSSEQPTETPERWYPKVLRYLGFSSAGIITTIRNVLNRLKMFALYVLALVGAVFLLSQFLPASPLQTSTHALAQAPDINQCRLLNQPQADALLSNFGGVIDHVYQYSGFNSSPTGGNLPNCSYTTTDSPNDALVLQQPLLQVWAIYDPQMATYQAEMKTTCGDNMQRCESLEANQQTELFGATRAFISYPAGTTQGLGMICFMLEGYTVKVSATPGTQDMLLQAVKTVIMNMNPSLPAPPVVS